MDTKASHKLPICFIAAVAFSTTSVHGKCAGDGHLQLLKKKEKVGDEQLGRGGMRKETRETFDLFLGVCCRDRVWGMEGQWGGILVLFWL